MSLPLGHALVGASAAVALWPERTPAGTRRAVAAGALLGMCPDADFVLSRLRILGWGWHHGFTHSVAFAVLIGAGCAWALGLRSGRGVAACVAAVVSHPLLDYVVTESRGVALAWPVTDHRYRLGIDALSYYRVTGGASSAAAALTLCLIELALFAPILALAIGASRRRWRRVEMPDSAGGCGVRSQRRG